MKKIVIILLAVLPIFLIVVISFAGRVFSEVSHVNVEKVEFVDDTENPYSDDKVIYMSKGETLQLKIKIYPELATDKRVTYISNDLDICTVDESGIVSAVGNKLGIAVITVKTVEKGMTDRIRINVTNKSVDYVRIIDSKGTDVEYVEMAAKDTIQLFNEVGPWSAENKKVKWTSSDPSIVQIDENVGRMYAIKPGTVVITVTTVEGGKTDTCVVTVNDQQAKLSFNFDSNPDIRPSGNGYQTTLKEFNLKDYLIYDQNTVNPENIVIEVSSNASYNAETGILTVNESGLVTITAKLNDGSGVTTTIYLLVH